MSDVRNFGERDLPDGYEDQPWGRLLRHMQIESYEHVLDWIAGKRILEVGCGTGYGTARMAEVASEVIGTDISEEAIEHCQSAYTSGELADRLSFMRIAAPEKASLPFPDESFDVVLSYQVIEHVQDDQLFLEELHRVLKPGGNIFVSTPNRNYRLLPYQKPWNAFHIREYSDPQLKARMLRWFKEVRIWHMGSEDVVARPEKDRVRRIRWMTLPFTLPFVPETVRRSILLRLMKLNQKKETGKPGGSDPIGFDRSAILIGEREQSVPNSMNLLAIGTKA